MLARGRWKEVAIDSMTVAVEVMHRDMAGSVSSTVIVASGKKAVEAMDAI